MKGVKNQALKSKDRGLTTAGGKCNPKEKWMQENLSRRKRKGLFTKHKWRTKSFSADVPPDFLKHTIRDSLVRGTGLFSLRLSS